MAEKRTKNGWQDPDALKDMIRLQCEGIISAHLRFPEIDRDAEKIPWKWTDEMGLKEAERVMRLAKTGWMTQAELPAGVKNAFTMLKALLIESRNAPDVDEGGTLRQVFVAMPPADASAPEYKKVKHVDQKSDTED